MYEIASLCGQICLGKQGENLARIVYFDEPSAWVNTFGEGKCELLHQRNGDESPYPVALDLENDRVCWKITASDTAIVGDGKCELHYSVDGIIVKSKIWTTTVLPSLSGEVVDAPEPQKTWVDEVLSAAEKVESATTHQPKIGENGNWLVWNTETMEYIDSGVSAKGVPSEPGKSATITEVTAEVDNTSGVPNVDVTMGGDEQNRSFHFAFSGLKCEPGEGEGGETVIVSGNAYEHLYTCTVEDKEVTTFTIDKDKDGNSFKLDGLITIVECPEEVSPTLAWRLDANRSVSNNVMFYKTTDNIGSGTYFRAKNERLDNGLWWSENWQKLSTSIYNNYIQSSYNMPGVDYITKLILKVPEAPVGTTITFYGRKVSS